MSNELFYVPGSESLGFHQWLNEKHPNLPPDTPDAEMQLLWNQYVFDNQQAQPVTTS